MAAHSRAEELIQRRTQPGEIRAPGQPVVAFLDKSDRDVPALEALGEAQAGLPGNGVVEHAVQQPHRASKRDLGARYEMTAAVFEQAKPIGVANRVVSRGQGDCAAFPKLLALRRIEPRPDEILGEVGCGSDPDERVDSLDSRERGEQIQPPMLEPIRICRPSVSASRTAIASSDQRPIVPTPRSPLDAPCPK
jgi:hypothetical protein